MSMSFQAKLATATIVAAGALSTSAAASPTFPPYWDLPGAFVGTGSLTLAAGPATTTCAIAVDGDLRNGPIPAFAWGGVTSGVMGSAAGAACSTNVPNCVVAATANLSLPWGIVGATGTLKVTISDINLSYAFTGPSCALNGATLTASGTMQGDFTNPGNLVFSGATGFTTTFGPGVVTSSLTFVNKATATPVSLV